MGADYIEQQDAGVVQGAGLEVDGVFGPVTDAVTREFQKRHGLVQDGKVGPTTLEAMRTVVA